MNKKPSYIFVDRTPIPHDYTDDGKPFAVVVDVVGSYILPELPSNGQNRQQKYRFITIVKGEVTVCDRAHPSKNKWFQGKTYQLVRNQGFCFHTLEAVELLFSVDGKTRIISGKLGGGGGETTTNPE